MVEESKPNKKGEVRQMNANEDAAALGTNAQGTPIPKKPKNN